MTSLVVYTKEIEDDKPFEANGARYIFSSKKQNRLLFTDNVTADKLLELYGDSFTLFARYSCAGKMQGRGAGNTNEVAAVMVSYKTLNSTRRAYESFRRFYPSLPMYAIDNGSGDANTAYINGIASEYTTPAINPYNYGHGLALHQATGVLRQAGYRFMFALDSDTEMEHGGIVEAMLAKLGNGYSIGKMYLTCEHGFVSNSDRGVRYIHPSAALYELNQYNALRPFALHGAPCIHNMIDAQLRGMNVVPFQIEDYLHHYGMETVKTIKLQDVNAAYLFPQRPPLVSFVIRYSDSAELKRCIDSITRQTNADYEIVPIQKGDAGAYWHSTIPIKVRGLYVYIIDAGEVREDFVSTVLDISTNSAYPPNIIIAKTIDESGNALPGDDAWNNGPVAGQIDIHNLIVRRELWMTDAINFGGRFDEFETIKDLFNRDDWQVFYWLDKVVAKVGNG